MYESPRDVGTPQLSQPGGTYFALAGRWVAGYSLRYLPNSAVWTPADCSQVGRQSVCQPLSRKVGQPPPVVLRLETTSWLWMYWPRRIEVRDGQHSESVTVWLVKVMPLSCRAASRGTCWNRFQSRSSARTKTTFLTSSSVPASATVAPAAASVGWTVGEVAEEVGGLAGSVAVGARSIGVALSVAAAVSGDAADASDGVVVSPRNPSPAIVATAVRAAVAVTRARRRPGLSVWFMRRRASSSGSESQASGLQM